MKLSRIKNFICGFIAVLISLFSFNYNVDAKTVYNMDYSTIETIINGNNEIKENIDFLFDYIETIKDDYYIFATYSHNTENYRTYNLYLLDKSTNITNFYYNLNKDKVLWFTVDFKSTNIFEFSYSENKYPNNTFNEIFSGFLSDIENGIGINTYHIQNFNSMPIENYDKFILLLYTNIPGGHMNTADKTDSWNIYYDLSVNGDLITGDKEILSYYDYVSSKKPGFQLSSNYANDLNGRDIYVITCLLNQFNDNYKYQYSYDNQNFYDMIGLDQNNLAYWLNVGLNIPIYFRILNESEEIVWSTKYNENLEFKELNKNISMNEFTRIIEDKKMIGVEFDFSQYLEFDDIYDFKLFLNGTQQDIRSSFNLNIYEDDWDDTVYTIELKVDNVTIEAFEYKPKFDDQSFNDKYDQILEDQLEEELGNSDYESVGGMIESLNSFMEAIREFVVTFFDLIMGFFNKLNIWIRSFIIGIFIVMVICKIVKVVRK